MSFILAYLFPSSSTTNSTNSTLPQEEKETQTNSNPNEKSSPTILLFNQPKITFFPETPWHDHNGCMECYDRCYGRCLCSNNNSL
jgi:hypothetical protein